MFSAALDSPNCRRTSRVSEPCCQRCPVSFDKEKRINISRWQFLFTLTKFTALHGMVLLSFWIQEFSGKEAQRVFKRFSFNRNLLSLVDAPKYFNCFVERRSLIRLLGPTLSHQCQDCGVHVLVFALYGRSIEWRWCLRNLFHDHFTEQRNKNVKIVKHHACYK